jgi:(p)ppGpp synthase/HD superfamily hydrolase
MNYSNAQLRKIESAVVFAVEQFEKYSKNPKPALLHSIKVGAKLMEYNMPCEVVVAGFLHDLLEDTKCTKKMIQKKFGSRVTLYVSALTMNYGLTDYKEFWYDGLRRIKKAGKNILLIKLIDMNDNLLYFIPRMNHAELERLFWKVRFVLRNTKKYWGHLPIYRQSQQIFQSTIKSKRIFLP